MDKREQRRQRWRDRGRRLRWTYWFYKLAQEFRKMALDLTRMNEEIAEMKTVTAGAIELMDRLAQEIRDNANDPEALNALADDIDANNQKVVAALVRNTDSSEEPAPEG